MESLVSAKLPQLAGISDTTGVYMSCVYVFIISVPVKKYA